MPTKITKYKTIDGKEFPTFTDAHIHEQTLKVVQDAKNAIIDVLQTTVDDQQRMVYHIDQTAASAFASMLVETDLMVRLKTIIK